MSGLIPQRFIEELLDRADLADLVGSRVNLKKSGSSYKACCPFHDEKTPSFHLRPDKGFYHCFGCGAHGDAISFLREFDGLGFTEAVEELAGRMGMEVPYDQAVREEMRQVKTLTGALDEASRYYQKALQQDPAAALARDYLAKRGLDQATIERFQLGFAPPQGDALSRAVSSETRKALITVKAISDKYGKPRDLFRNRVMFPIRNTRGRTVAFGGRTLGDDKAKYINSPESEVFHKSQTLYGLYEAQQANRRLDRLLVVEGYMDVIALAQNGITDAVAASGTATNQDSLQALLRHVRHVIFCFDGDQAGYRAADKALENALELISDGIHIQFLMLPEGEDPDTLVRQEGEAAFRARMDAATPLSRQLFARQGEGLDLTLPEHRGELKSRCEPLLRKMPRSTLREAMWHELRRLCGRPQYPQGGRRGDKRQSGSRHPAGAQGAMAGSAGQPGIRLDRDIMLCAALYADPTLAEEVQQATADTEKLGRSHGFAGWLLERGLRHSDQVLRALATDPVARDRFRDLFNPIEHYPASHYILKDAREILDRLQQRIPADVKALLDYRGRISDLSPSERERLRELTRLRQRHNKSH
ncbi:MAG: DNA primase [Oleiphilaceae bacterium]|nr:DNA primase [Oleiphilaceae bacterium]